MWFLGKLQARWRRASREGAGHKSLAMSVSPEAVHPAAGGPVPGEVPAGRNVSSMAMARAQSGSGHQGIGRPGLASITDRTHKANKVVADLRKRRSSLQDAQLRPAEALEQLEVPDCLSALNRVSRSLLCCGCSYPPQSVWHVRIVTALQFAAHATIIATWNSARSRGSISGVLQIGVHALQIMFFASWRHARTHLTFDNTLRSRKKTIELMEAAGRDDMVERVDQEISRPSCFRVMFLTPAMCNVAIFPVLLLHVGKEMTMLEIAACQLSFSIAQYTYAITTYGWVAVCRYDALQYVPP